MSGIVLGVSKAWPFILLWPGLKGPVGEGSAPTSRLILARQSVVRNMAYEFVCSFVAETG